LNTEAGKDQLNDPFDFTPDRSSQQHWDSIFRLYNNATPIPEPSIPDPSRRGFGRAEE
jgi:hypothetical protein